MSTKTFKLPKNTKMYISQNPKKHKIQGTYKTTERGNQKYTTQSAIYTVPFNRVLIVPCYYNIQTINCRNIAELMFSQCISRRCQPRLWNFEKSKFTFLKIQNPKNTGYIQNNETGEPKINTAICWFTQSHSTECWLNLVTTIFKQ